MPLYADPQNIFQKYMKILTYDSASINMYYPLFHIQIRNPSHRKNSAMVRIVLSFPK